MSLKSSRMALSLCLALLLQKSYSEVCKSSQPHITFGENFVAGGTKKQKQFTIGWVTEPNCYPKAKLLLRKTSKEELRIEVAHSEEYKNEKLGYGKVSNFAYISRSQAQEYQTWSLELEGMIEYGPFTIPKRYADSSLPIRIMVVADMDATEVSKPTIRYMEGQDETQYDMIVHVGDLAYDIHGENGKTGDQFFETMSKSTTRIPYIAIPGNHEFYDDGKLFNYRFRMPGTEKLYGRSRNHYFSFDYKNLHFVSLDFDYNFLYHPERESEAFNWLKNDLIQARKRKDDGFIVVYSHRPYYCTDKASKDCWTNFWYLKRYEDLINKYNVNLVVHGHVHIYQRSANVKDFELGQKGKNGSGPVYVIAGHSGTEHFFPAKFVEEDFKSSLFPAVNFTFI